MSICLSDYCSNYNLWPNLKTDLGITAYWELKILFWAGSSLGISQRWMSDLFPWKDANSTCYTFSLLENYFWDKVSYGESCSSHSTLLCLRAVTLLSYYLNQLNSFFFKFVYWLYTVVVFRHTRRGRQISLRMVVSRHVVSGIWTQDLRKSLLLPLTHLGMLSLLPDFSLKLHF